MKTRALSPLIYPGSKSKGIPSLMRYIPFNLYEVVSPFVGGGSLEIFLAKQSIRVFGSDGYGDLVNFWDHALECPRELASEALKLYPMTPDKYAKIKSEWDGYTDKLERAAKFYAINRASWNGINFQCIAPNGGKFTINGIKRLGNFSVECLDYKDALDKYPTTYAYLDPPYDIKDSNLYGHDGSMHRGFDHDELADYMRERQSSWLMSYNNDSAIINRYKDFPGVKLAYPQWTHTMSGLGNRTGKELLIIKD